MKLKLLAAAFAGLLTVGAQAGPIVNDNVRPQTVNPAPGGEANLQTILDGLFGAGWGTVNGSQSTAGQWGAATGSGTTIPTLYWEASAFQNRNRFGMWFGTDTNNLLLVPLFWGQADDGPGPGGGGGIFTSGGLASTAAVSIGNGSLSIGSAEIASCVAQVNCTFAPIVDARINPFTFGFYFETARRDDPLLFPSGGSVIERAFSIDNLSTLSTGEAPRFLAYQQGVTTNWAFAYEDGQDNRDSDYNDMVVKIESIRAIPLPGTVALLGIGLLGAGLLRRRGA